MRTRPRTSALPALALAGALTVAAATTAQATTTTEEPAPAPTEAMGAAPVAPATTSTLQSVAHRGDKQHHPDNSLAGIASAVAKGADWIEIDVVYNPDGDTFFLSHDNGCRGPGGSATIDSAPYATVVARCALPELADVLADFSAQGYASFVIEFKSTSRTVTSAPPALVATIDAVGVQDDVWVSSLSDAALGNVRDTGTQVPLMRVRDWSGPLTVSQAWLSETVALGFDAVNVNIGAWTDTRVQQARSLGLVTVGWAWPTASEADNTTAIARGLDMFMTDRLDDLHAKLGR